MDLSAAHLHLVLNHIPVQGTMLFAPLILLWGLVRHSRDVTQIGLGLTVLLAVTASHPPDGRAGRGATRKAALV